jgi:hypothetical protein
MMNFKETMFNAAGQRVEIPAAITEYLAWIEAQDGLVRSYPQGGVYALIDPSAENSCISICPSDKGHAEAWVGSDRAEVSERLKPFCRTGGDGSFAAFWADGAGETHIMHLGSGSGSTMTGVLVSDPVDFLRLLAIGYYELCWPDQHKMTPAEIHGEEFPPEDYEGMEDELPAPPAQPLALRAWVSEKFGVTIPERASEILGELPDMADENSSDPFCVWLRKVGG